MKKILIVEDELAYSKLLRDQLTTKDYQVTVTENGEKGLEIAKKEKPDLILLDIRMPKMDGMTMLDILRKTESIKNTKVIMLTNIEPDTKITNDILIDQPLFYFIKSDIELSELLNKIKELLAD